MNKTIELRQSEKEIIQMGIGIAVGPLALFAVGHLNMTAALVLSGVAIGLFASLIALDRSWDRLKLMIY